MREILFRGQTRRYGEKVKMNGEKVPSNWVYGGVCQGKGDFSIIYGSMDMELEQPTEKRVVYTDTIGQYTGLTDKNGTKIFEGDIVQYTDEEGYYPEDCCDFVGKIVLEHGAFGIATNDNIPIDLDNWCDNDNFVSLWELYWNLEPEGEMLSSIEVIGNIHDNPELLKERENNA